MIIKRKKKMEQSIRKNTDSIIDFKNVTRILTAEEIPVVLVKDINLDIKRGEFVAIIGPSGSGKSSLMYLMGLLDRETTGELIVDGVDVTLASNHDREIIRLKKIGFIFQFHFLLPEFTAIENVMMPMKKLNKLGIGKKRKRAKMLLKHFGLENAINKKPHQLSGGERQRVAVARAVANEPDIILADEPTGNLDTHNADIIFELFRKMVDEEGKTIVFITHDLRLAELADRKIILVDGKIVESYNLK